MQTVKITFPVLSIMVVLVALVTAFWVPTPWDGKAMIHGDPILHGRSTWEYHEWNIDQFDNFAIPTETAYYLSTCERRKRQVIAVAARPTSNA